MIQARKSGFYNLFGEDKSLNKQTPPAFTNYHNCEGCEGVERSPGISQEIGDVTS